MGTNSDQAPVIGLVLAGGASRRMGGQSKALATLAGRPMIDHVIAALTPQLDELWLSVAATPGPLPHLPQRQLVDPEPRHCGPLAGLVQGLKDLPDDGWLVLAPCDAPFLPDDLVRGLLGAADSGDLVVVAREGEQLHPTFSAWRKAALPRVSDSLGASKGLWQTIDSLPHAIADWPLPDQSPFRPSPFFNVNEPGDLARAENWLRQQQQEGDSHAQ